MIFLSAGHDPTSKGASYMNFNEFDEASKWVDMISSYFSETEISTVPAGSLRDKVRYINTMAKVFPGAHIAVEVHFNSAKNADGINIGSGSETLYYPGSEKGEKFARIMQKHLSEIFKPNRGVKEGWYQGNPEKGALFFLKSTKCPALIIEPEFIHKEPVIKGNRVKGCNAVVRALKEITN